jgi:WD40 repeat protein
MRVWDRTTGVEVLPALDARVGGAVYGLAFNENGTVLATAHQDGSARVWEMATGQVKALIPHAHTIQVLGVAFDSREHLATAGGGDNKIKIWDWRADTGSPIQTLETPQNIIRNPTFSPDGKHLAAVVATPARVWMWDRTTGEKTTRHLPQAFNVCQAIFRPGGRLAVVSGDRIDFLGRDLSDGPALIGCHAGELCCAAFSPDGKRLATGAGYKGRGEVRIWDTSRWEKNP